MGEAIDSAVHGAPVLRVVLDANGFDDLAVDDETLALVDAAIAAGRLELLTLSYLLAEVGATPDPEKVERLRRLTTTVESPVWVWGYTAWGEGAWGDHATAATFDDAAGPARRHYVDAQALVTAQRLGVPLVSADKALLRKARRNGVPTMSAAEVLGLFDPRRHQPRQAPRRLVAPTPARSCRT